MKKTNSEQQLNLLMKVIIYVFLFGILPVLFLVLCLNFFIFREIFMQGILFFIFILANGYIFLNCLKLTNKWYLVADAFFIVVFAGLYYFVEHDNRHFILLFFTVYATWVHFLLMVRNIMREGIAPLKKHIFNLKYLFQKRIPNLINVVKPIDVYVKNNDQATDNFSVNNDKNIAEFQIVSQKKQENKNDFDDFEARCKSFFELFDDSIPLTCCEVIKIHRKTNINILEQRKYTKKEFIKPLVCLGLVKNAAQYNNKRRTNTNLKQILLGSDSQGMLDAIAILKGMKVTESMKSSAKKMHNNWAIIK